MFYDINFEFLWGKSLLFDFTCKIFVSVFSDVLTFTKKLNDCEETNEICTNNHLV